MTRIGRRGAGLMAAAGLVAVVGVTVVRPQFSAAEAERPAQVSVDEVEELERAEQILIQRCIERAGFQYMIVPRFVDPVPFTFSYVVDDAGWADKHGYGAALRRRAEAKVDPNERYFRSLPPTRQEALATALNGPEPVGLTATLPGGQVVQHSDKGCQSEAQRELYGDLPTWYASTKVIQNLKGHRFGMVLGDPRYQAALPAWSECMRDRGYRFTSPDAARSEKLTQVVELRQAGAEARCAISTGLGALVRELDTSYDAQLREEHQSLLATRVDLQRRALPKARAL
ncbi:hypothetical protein GCM10029976_094970 [Kribbella albertanoniae]|uniref:Uncharacterized protein n=1 Tax=Kribbella albertanoniae TaxID=1266829 RepID=A0A4R4QF37_9ACTN|nr:hypothetical protein [Kribbella albertanoniae]TDC34147.1 hypothetical protein E1261_04290 [Kribbella albertanoniae]